MLQELLGPELAVVDVLQTLDLLWGRDDLVIVPALLVVDPHWVSSSADLNNLQHTSISQLFGHSLSVIPIRLVLRIGLDAPDEVWLCEVDNVHETGELVLELRGDSVLLLLASHFLVSSVLAKHFDILGILLEKVCNKLVGTTTHAFNEIVAQLILVLVKEGVCAVVDRPREVLDDKPGRLRLNLIKAAVALVLLDELVAEALVRTLGHHALLVQDGEDAHCLGSQDVHRVLIVGEIQSVPGDAFALVQLLLELEDKGVEELLEPLVGEVDAELLKRIHFEALEAKNVQHANEQLDVSSVADGQVCLRDNEVEDHAIQRLGQRVAVVRGCADVHRAANLLGPRDACGVAHGTLQVRPLHARELGDEVHGLAALGHHHGALAVVGGGVELRVPEVQDGRDEGEHLAHVVVADAYGLHGVDAPLEEFDVVHVLQGSAGGARSVGEVRELSEALQVELHLLLDLVLLQERGEGVLQLPLRK
mmetsp:Transcript_51451/g.123871  ORF Transcript_51451/g.123871 Transcript_51451/m.123871 type:complete len:478 (-) Transcript_51451:949-2382(-)